MFLPWPFVCFLSYVFQNGVGFLEATGTVAKNVNIMLSMVLLMEEILHQFMGNIPIFTGFLASQVVNRISSINSSSFNAGVLFNAGVNSVSMVKSGEIVHILRFTDHQETSEGGQVRCSLKSHTDSVDTCGYHKLSCWIVLYQVILLVIKKSYTSGPIKSFIIHRIVTVSPRFLMHGFRFLSVTHLSTLVSCVIIYIYMCNISHMIHEYPCMAYSPTL